MSSSSWIDRMGEARVVDVAAELGGFEVRESGASWSLGPCPLCGAERRHPTKRDRRGALGSSKAKPAGWECHECGERGDSLELVCLEREQARWKLLSDEGKARVRAWCERFLGLDGARPAYRAPEPTRLSYPPEDELCALLEATVPVTLDSDVAGWLASRGLDPELVERHALARALPVGAECPAWASRGRRPWSRTGHRLIFPLVDHHGVVCSVLGRRVVSADDTVPKSLAPARPHKDHPGYGRAGLLVASAPVLEVLREGRDLERLLVTEGEVDFLTWCTEVMLMPLAAVGIFSGSWSPAWAARLADGAELAIATDLDEAGHKYAAQLERSVAGRVRVGRWRCDGARDANEARMKGESLFLPAVPAQASSAPSEPPELDDEASWPTDADAPPARRASLPEGAADGADDWGHLLARGPKGALRGSLGNAVTVLEHDVRWAGVIAYDERFDQVVLLSCPPIARLHGGPFPRALVDADLPWISRWLESVYGVEWPLEKVHKAIVAVAHQHAFDGVRDYLEALTWDGTPRIDDWLVRLCGVRDDVFARGVGARWLLSAVARALAPGAKVDCVLVLEGKQGVGKSRALAALLPEPRWFLDRLPDLKQKDAQLALQGPWLIEIAELDAFSRSEAHTIKSFTSAQADKYRPPYGTIDLYRPRRCVFAATTNESQWQKDSTGGRRFWPVRVGRIDVAAVVAERDQLWAEAVVRFRAGSPWHLDTPELLEAAEEVQEERHAADPWEDALRGFLRAKNLKHATPRVPIEDCLAHLGIERKDWGNRGEQMRLSRVLSRLGWDRRQRRDGPGGERRWAYEPTSRVTNVTDQLGDGEVGDVGDGPTARSGPASAMDRAIADFDQPDQRVIDFDAARRAREGAKVGDTPRASETVGDVNRSTETRHVTESPTSPTPKETERDQGKGEERARDPAITRSRDQRDQTHARARVRESVGDGGDMVTGTHDYPDEDFRDD